MTDIALVSNLTEIEAKLDEARHNADINRNSNTYRELRAVDSELVELIDKLKK